MTMETIMTFIQPELLILIAFLWCVGLFLKMAPWFTVNGRIPFVLLVISFIITIFYIAIVLHEGFTIIVFINGTIQAVIIAATTVFGNELLKQLFTKKE